MAEANHYRNRLRARARAFGSDPLYASVYPIVATAVKLQPAVVITLGGSALPVVTPSPP